MTSGLLPPLRTQVYCACDPAANQSRPDKHCLARGGCLETTRCDDVDNPSQRSTPRRSRDCTVSDGFRRSCTAREQQHQVGGDLSGPDHAHRDPGQLRQLDGVRALPALLRQAFAVVSLRMQPCGAAAKVVNERFGVLTTTAAQP
ncbi:MAG: hypothetical protein HOQ24_06850 [Mycobacteriaceae bacterium]|nr:hypothetical protein [Mycobacteriaceae bacterium]